MMASSWRGVSDADAVACAATGGRAAVSRKESRSASAARRRLSRIARRLESLMFSRRSSAAPRQAMARELCAAVGARPLSAVAGSGKRWPCPHWAATHAIWRKTRRSSAARRQACARARCARVGSRCRATRVSTSVPRSPLRSCHHEVGKPRRCKNRHSADAVAVIAATSACMRMGFPIAVRASMGLAGIFIACCRCASPASNQSTNDSQFPNCMRITNDSHFQIASQPMTHIFNRMQFENYAGMIINGL